MAARCGSCSYPLSVSDSVSCCECLSYFHIDCAQLVGFPYYELSSDPIRNTFHCQTCKILPLPRQSEGYSDSDSDDECAMPSRQLDYHLEGQPEFANDMNEIKGTVQDLSDLCKDMFREINELKSINLTLRCCVENLRHDGDQRDGIISELKKRIEALEGKGSTSVFKPITTDMYVDRISIEKEEDAERYLTPDPEYSRLKEVEDLERGGFSDEIPLKNVIQHADRSSFESKDIWKDNIAEQSQSEWESSENAIDIPDKEDSQSVPSEFELEKEEGNNQNIEEKVHFAEEEIITTVGGETPEEDKNTSMKDWGWRGNKAIQLKDNKNNTSTEEEEEGEEEESEESGNEDTEAQGWEILDEDEKTEIITTHNEEEVLESARSVQESEKEEGEKRVSWAKEVEDRDEEEESIDSDEITEEPISKSGEEYMTEVFQAIIRRRSTLEAEETEETNEGVAEGSDRSERSERSSLKDEEGVEPSKHEGDIGSLGSGAEVEGRSSQEGSRLEGEPRLEAEEGTVPEGDAREGGQSPEFQGEAQPSEFSEGSEPPPPPQPQHTPDDLWDYLKETVSGSGEHPATVEEFVQKLIGTLEHVPEEYLKPVIDFNVKRATSPSVTDGDHLDAKYRDNQSGEEDHGIEQTDLGEVHLQANGEVALEGEGESSVTEDVFPSKESPALPETTSNIPEDPSESTGGYSALEGALFGGFWVAWAMYSFWDI